MTVTALDGAIFMDGRRGCCASDYAVAAAQAVTAAGDVLGGVGAEVAEGCRQAVGSMFQGNAPDEAAIFHGEPRALVAAVSNMVERKIHVNVR